MANLPLFQMINLVRAQLKQKDTFGELVSEKFLILDGDLCGQWFCFENADIQWRFDSNICKIFQEGREIDEMRVSVAESANEPVFGKKAA